MKFTEEKGFTLIELLAVIGIICILMATALYNLKLMNDPLSNGRASVEHFLHLARSRAISGTQFVIVDVSTTRKLVGSSSDACDGTKTALGDLFLDMPYGSSLSDLNATVCFTPRGLAGASANFGVVDLDGKTASIKVALGGGTAIE